MESTPSPSREEILRDLQAGDASSLRVMLRKNKGRITDGWPFGKERADR
jgi:hypothetical protein